MEEETTLELAGKKDHVAICEENKYLGCLGESIAIQLVLNQTASIQFVATQDTLSESGTPEQTMDTNGLDKKAIIAALEKAMK